MAFQVFPLSSLQVTPWRKYTARSSQPTANTCTRSNRVDLKETSRADLLRVLCRPAAESHLIIEAHIDHEHLSHHADPTRATRIVRVYATSEPHLVMKEG